MTPEYIIAISVAVAMAAWIILDLRKEGDW